MFLNSCTASSSPAFACISTPRCCTQNKNVKTACILVSSSNQYACILATCFDIFRLPLRGGAIYYRVFVICNSIYQVVDLGFMRRVLFTLSASRFVSFALKYIQVMCSRSSEIEGAGFHPRFDKDTFESLPPRPHTNTKLKKKLRPLEEKKKGGGAPSSGSTLHPRGELPPRDARPKCFIATSEEFPGASPGALPRALKHFF